MKTSIWQAFMEIVGRPIQNGLIAFMMVCLIAFCGVSTFFTTLIESFHQGFASISGYGAVVSIEDYTQPEDWEDFLAKTAEYEAIIGYNNELEARRQCTPVDFVNVPYEGVSAGVDDTKVYVSGNMNTAFCNYFRNGDFRLIEGDFPTPEKPGALLEQGLAEKNGLAVGDSITVAWREKECSFAVTGIYEALTTPKAEAQQEGFYQLSPMSFVFCDAGSYEELTGEFHCNIMRFFVSRYEDIEACCDYLSELTAPTENSYVVDGLAAGEDNLTEVVDLLKQISTVTLDAVYILCVVVMSLLVVLWLRAHARTIAIYTVLGQHPGRIVWNLLLELLMVTIPVVIIAFISFLYLFRTYAKNIFLWVLEVFAVSVREQEFAMQMWEFEMNTGKLLGRTVILEMVLLAMAFSGAWLMLHRPVRKFKEIE